MKLQVSIRNGRLDDLADILNLFTGTVSAICNSDYNSDQIREWVSGAENKTRWHEIITGQYFLVVEDQNRIVGFCSLDKGNYIDLIYVHKDHQHQGITFQLYTEIEKEAIRKKQNILISDVSINARSFFERIGFISEKEQVVIRNGTALTNYKMKKILGEG